MQFLDEWIVEALHDDGWLSPSLLASYVSVRASERRVRERIRTTSSGREIVSVLTEFGYQPVSRSGRHVRLRYETPDTEDVRNVDVPMHREVTIGTRRSIADQCGARGFEAWCRRIDEHA